MRNTGLVDGTLVGETIGAETSAEQSEEQRGASAFDEMASSVTKPGGVREVRNE